MEKNLNGFIKRIQQSQKFDNGSSILDIQSGLKWMELEKWFWTKDGWTESRGKKDSAAIFHSQLKKDPGGRVTQNLSCGLLQ